MIPGQFMAVQKCRSKGHRVRNAVQVAEHAGTSVRQLVVQSAETDGHQRIVQTGFQQGLGTDALFPALALHGQHGRYGFHGNSPCL